MIIKTIGQSPEQSTLWGTFNLFVVTNDAVSVSGSLALRSSNTMTVIYPESPAER